MIKLRRIKNNWYNTTNVPSIVCPNETDKFSVSNSFAHLDYPVGLLTADEIVIAGASGNNGSSNNSYYLYTNYYYWTKTPDDFSSQYSVSMFSVGVNGILYSQNISYTDHVRSVVSLKSGIEFEHNEDETGTNPYIVKYN